MLDTKIMKIALISPFPGKNLSGAQEMSAVAKYSFRLVQSLCSENTHPDEIEVITSQCPTSCVGEETVFANKKIHCAVKVLRLKSKGWNFFELLGMIKEGKYDLVHAQHETFLYGGAISILLFPLFVFLARLFSPVIVTLHHIIEPKQINRDFAQIHRSHLPGFAIKLGYAVFYRLLGHAASGITVHDNSDKIILCKNYGAREQKISVIPHGSDNSSATVEDSREELKTYFGIPSNTSVIFGFFAYIDESKGLDYLISEFSEYSKRHSDSTLIITGSLHPEYKKHPDFLKKFQALRAQVLAAPHLNILWYGNLDPKDEGRFYKLVDCVILPYKDFNGGSASLSHAIGNGTPFLVSEKFERLIPDKNLIFSLRQSALADKLEEFSSHSGILAAKARSYSVAVMHKQTWDIVASSFLALYHSAARKVHRDILLLGAYGQNNLGDEILLDRCLSSFSKDDCIVASAQPSLTEKEYGVAAIHSQCHSFGKLLAFLHAKTIVVGGGDQFKIFKKSVGRFRYALIAQYSLIALLARILGKRLFFVSIGIGDVSSGIAKTLTSWTIRLASFVTFRDRNSFMFVQEHAPRVHSALSTDLAFLEPTEDPGMRKPPQAEAVHVLGIAPVFNIDHEGTYPLVIREIGSALDGYLDEKPNNRAVFLPFQTGFNKHHDIITSTEILSQMNQKARCAIDETLSKESVGNAYRSLQYLWGMRLHSLILACIHAVPFIALIYDVKVKNFLEEIDCSDWGITLDESFSSGKLLALQRNLEEHAPEIRHHLAVQAEKLRGRAQISAELLRCIGEERPFEWSQEARQYAASWGNSNLPSIASPLHHHHTPEQPAWKK